MNNQLTFDNKTLVKCFILPSVISLTCFTANASPEISGGATLTYLSADDSNIDNEFTFSTDLVLNWTFDQDNFYVYLEANNSPKDNAVSSLLPEANADAGSALDEDRKGRIQISEIGYRHVIDKSQSITSGLIDVSGHFDQSRIASDENSQFLGVSFVQNPTIEFPDYTLGLVYQNEINSELVLRAAIASSHGLADNPNLSYAQLVDVDSNDKGLFSIVSLSQNSGNWIFKGGLWINTAAHETFDGSDTNANNSGAYFLTGYQVDGHGVNLRLGTSKESVSLAQNFVALSYQYKQAAWAFGVGAAKIFLSDAVSTDLVLAGTNKDTQQLEAYARYKINSNFLITADIQTLKNSNFSSSASGSEDKQTLLGLRLTYLFE